MIPGGPPGDPRDRPRRPLLLSALLALVPVLAMGIVPTPAPPAGAQAGAAGATVSNPAHGSGTSPASNAAGDAVDEAAGSRDLDGDGVVRVVAVGDSILQGAAPQIREAFASLGIEAVVDTEVSRSTLAGEDLVRMYSTFGADALVVLLGANDSADAATFGDRVSRVVAAAGDTPLLFWLSIPEVRDYYPSANAVLRESLGSRPGGTVLDWAGVAAGPGVTAGDGLHLTPAGVPAMTGFVVSSVVAGLDSAAEQRSVGTGSTPASGAATTAAPTTVAPGTSAPAADGDVQDVTRGVRASATDSVDSVVGGVGWAVALVVAGLVAAGLGLALWSLWVSRPLHKAQSGA